ncbi:hypothetical protein HY745_08020 [Candidatus Desantisbacteria bacterium]|nr:hypothetical protein [Candidatus Desantisbacteria bacterium]
MNINILNYESLITAPHVLEIVVNMTEKERKDLKKLTIKFLIKIIITYIILTVLFILFIQDLRASASVKWAFVISFLVSGFCLSKIFNYWIMHKQKKFLESTKYACMRSLELP